MVSPSGGFIFWERVKKYSVNVQNPTADSSLGLVAPTRWSRHPGTRSSYEAKGPFESPFLQFPNPMAVCDDNSRVPCSGPFWRLSSPPAYDRRLTLLRKPAGRCFPLPAPLANYPGGDLADARGHGFPKYLPEPPGRGVRPSRCFAGPASFSAREAATPSPAAPVPS